MHSGDIRYSFNFFFFVIPVVAGTHLVQRFVDWIASVRMRDSICRFKTSHRAAC